jgi:uncharacterized protein (TIGR02118 family)
MIKLVALFHKPSDPEEFDRSFAAAIVPLMEKLPGLKKLETTRVTGAPFGESKFHLMVELSFADRESLDAAMASKEGKAIARDLLRFAKDVASLFHGEVRSEP